MRRTICLSVLGLLVLGTAYAAQQRVSSAPKGHDFIGTRRSQEHREVYTIKKGGRPNGKWVSVLTLGPSAGIEESSLYCGVDFDDYSGSNFTGKVKFELKVGGDRVDKRTIELTDGSPYVFFSDSFDLGEYTADDEFVCTATVKKVKPRFAEETIATITSGVMAERADQAASGLRSSTPTATELADAKGPKALYYSYRHYGEVDFYENRKGASPKGVWVTSRQLGSAAEITEAYINCQNNFFDNDDSCPSGSIDYLLEIAGTPILEQTYEFPKGGCEAFPSVGVTADLTAFEPTDALVCTATVKKSKQRFVNTSQPYISVSIDFLEFAAARRHEDHK